VRWRGVWRSRVLAARHALAGHGSAQRRAAAGNLALVLLLVAFSCVALISLFRMLARSGATAAELGAVLALALDAAIVALLVFDLESLASIVILDRDLDLLRAAPLPPRSLLAIKLADALPRTSAALMVLALPALIAYGTVCPLPAWVWLATPVLLAALWLVPLGAGFALTLELMRRLPARRAREVLGLLPTLTVTALWLANLFLWPRLAAEGGDPLSWLRAMLSRAAHLRPYSPGQWVTAILEGARSGDLVRLAGGAAALMLGALASSALALASASRHLESVLAAARTPIPRKGARRRAAGGAPRAHPRSLRAAVFDRDRKLYLRDWTVLSDVLTAAVLWTLLPLVSTVQRSLGEPVLVRAMLITLSVGMGYEIASRALPLERRAVALMRLAPVATHRWVALKLASAGAIALAIVGTAGVILAGSARLPPGDWLAILAAVLPALALSVALGLWTGARFGNPDWTSPRAVLTLGGRLMAASLMVAQVAGWLILVAISPERARPTLASPLTWLPGVLALALAALPIRAVTARLARIEYLR
jgi:ABC-2 type transport system permease protein